MSWMRQARVGEEGQGDEGEEAKTKWNRQAPGEVSTRTCIAAVLGAMHSGSPRYLSEDMRIRGIFITVSALCQIYFVVSSWKPYIERQRRQTCRAILTSTSLRFAVCCFLRTRMALRRSFGCGNECFDLLQILLAITLDTTANINAHHLLSKRA